MASRAFAAHLALDIQFQIPTLPEPFVAQRVYQCLKDTAAQLRLVSPWIGTGNNVLDVEGRSLETRAQGGAWIMGVMPWIQHNTGTHADQLWRDFLQNLTSSIYPWIGIWGFSPLQASDPVVLCNLWKISLYTHSRSFEAFLPIIKKLSEFGIGYSSAQISAPVVRGAKPGIIWSCSGERIKSCAWSHKMQRMTT
jgi:hypothetical protein